MQLIAAGIIDKMRAHFAHVLDGLHNPDGLEVDA
jgi:hypothetical protein